MSTYKKVYCVFSLESPHRGDSNEYTQYTIFNMTKKFTIYYPKSAAMGFFQGTQEQVRNSRGKRAISVRAIEVLLYLFQDHLNRCDFDSLPVYMEEYHSTVCFIVCLKFQGPNPG